MTANLGQPCPKHHRLKHGSVWTPAGASKDSPPGWTSPSGRYYANEQQDWEPPDWRPHLMVANEGLDGGLPADPGWDPELDLHADPGRDPDLDLPEDPFPGWHHSRPRSKSPRQAWRIRPWPAPLEDPFPQWLLLLSACD